MYHKVKGNMYVYISICAKNTSKYKYLPVEGGSPVVDGVTAKYYKIVKL